jgi:hypothetical protein
LNNNVGGRIKMEINIVQTILGGFLASVVWFIIGGALYMNPFIAKIYKNAKDSPGLKKWQNVPQWLIFTYIGVLIQCLLWAFVFTFIKSILPEVFLVKVFIFGLILFVVKIIPRFIDMWIQSTYPDKLLVVEFVNGTIGSFITAAVFAYII